MSMRSTLIEDTNYNLSTTRCHNGKFNEEENILISYVVHCFVIMGCYIIVCLYITLSYVSMSDYKSKIMSFRDADRKHENLSGNR